MSDGESENIPIDAVHWDALLHLAQRIVRESGDPMAPGWGDGSNWLRYWLSEPLPAYGGISPAEMLQRPDGLSLVTQTILQIQSGAYA